MRFGLLVARVEARIMEISAVALFPESTFALWIKQLLTTIATSVLYEVGKSVCHALRNFFAKNTVE